MNLTILKVLVCVIGYSVARYFLPDSFTYGCIFGAFLMGTLGIIDILDEGRREDRSANKVLREE